jgi:hypothetical protein
MRGERARIRQSAWEIRPLLKWGWGRGRGEWEEKGKRGKGKGGGVRNLLFTEKAKPEI